MYAIIEKRPFLLWKEKICIRVLYKINYLNNASLILVVFALTFRLADSNIDSEKMKVLVQVLKKIDFYLFSLV
jgi:hypothetical protein